MIGAEKPLGEPISVPRQVLGEWRQDRGGARLYRVAALVVFAAEEHEGARLAAFLLHHMGDRAPAFDRRLFGFERLCQLRQLAEARIEGPEPPRVQLVGLLRRPLVGRQRGESGRAGRTGEALHFVDRQQTRIESHILNAEVVDPRLRITLSELKRDGRADGFGQFVGHDGAFFLHRSVHENPHASRLARAIVGHEHVRPAVRGQRIARQHLQTILGPTVNQMRSHPAVFDPQIPASEVLAVVHPRQRRACRLVIRQEQPCAVAERLVAFKIARAWN